jgi:hypothetical protein
MYFEILMKVTINILTSLSSTSVATRPGCKKEEKENDGYQSLVM